MILWCCHQQQMESWNTSHDLPWILFVCLFVRSFVAFWYCYVVNGRRFEILHVIFPESAHRAADHKERRDPIEIRRRQGYITTVIHYLKVYFEIYWELYWKIYHQCHSLLENTNHSSAWYLGMYLLGGIIFHRWLPKKAAQPKPQNVPPALTRRWFK